VSLRTRRFVNDPAEMVAEMLEGYVAAHAELIALSDGMVVRASPKPSGRVGLVVANGSGHEPALIGWVGPGLLDVNVPGPIFASPGPARIVAGIREADRGAGVLLLVSSHAGDIMNASVGLDQARSEGRRVEMVVLYDDIASGPPDRPQDRRGGPGLFFVWKIVGALAESGADLGACAAMAARVRDATRSIAAAMGTVVHPISGQPLGSLDESQLSVGMGVHGEGGAALDDRMSADEIASFLMSRLVDDADAGSGARVGLLVNNAGSLTLLELSILYRGARHALEARGIEVARSWIGSYATTLDQVGFGMAISLLDEEMETLYDAGAHGAAFMQVRVDR
jgi:phosphoenolpyruvate---glycerone phosphotransferase subunit DhaK